MSVRVRVLVTGAGGFVCRHMVDALLLHGCRVYAHDRHFAPELRQQWAAWGENITFIESDVMDLPGFEVDAVIHGAALTASPEDAGHSPEDNFRANLNPVLHLLEWANTHCTGRAVFVSSSAVYRHTEPGPVTEDQPAHPLGLYAVAKQTTENLVETIRNVYSRDVCTIRLSNIYGPLENASATRPRLSVIGNMLLDALHTGEITVNTREPARDWTFAPDIGQAVYRLIMAESLTHALVNVAAGQVLTQMQIAEVLQKLLPGLKIKAVDAEHHLTRRGHLSNARLTQETGFTAWTPFEDGLRQCITQGEAAL